MPEEPFLAHYIELQQNSRKNCSLWLHPAHRVGGGGHDTGLEEPLPEDRVCLCVRISCLAERGCQRFTDEIQPPPGVLTRDAAFRFESRRGRLATRRDLRGLRRKERLWSGCDGA